MYGYKFNSNAAQKSICPECKKKTYVGFVTANGELLDAQFGKCDRASKCGYTSRPKQVKTINCVFVPFDSIEDYSAKTFLLKQGENKFYIFKTQVCEVEKNGLFHSEYLLTVKRNDYNINMLFDANNAKTFTESSVGFTAVTAPKKVEPVYIPQNILDQCSGFWAGNPFTDWLELNLGYDMIRLEQVLSDYKVGAVKDHTGKVYSTFPLIDPHGNTHFIQAKQFDQDNHSEGRPTSMHTLIKRYYKASNEPCEEWIDRYIEHGKVNGKMNCYFGSHLLPQYPSKPVAIVEAPKTAIYAAIVLPEYLWLATMSLGMFSLDRSQCLNGRTVFVIPDASQDGSTYQVWKDKAEHFQSEIENTTFQMVDFIEQASNEKQREDGLDLADWIETQDWL
jgi:hypothetical protein